MEKRTNTPSKELEIYNYYMDTFFANEKYEECFNGILELAKNGFPLAESQIGYFYLEGYGVKQDFDKAFFWTYKAANKNERSAQYNLATYYLEEVGARYDILKAMYWFCESARREYKPAILACEKLELNYHEFLREYIINVSHEVYQSYSNRNIVYTQSLSIEETKLNVLDRVSFRSLKTGKKITYIVSNYQNFDNYKDLYNFAIESNNAFSELEEEMYKDVDPDINAKYIDEVGAVMFELTNIHTIPDAILPLYLNLEKVHTTELGNERIKSNIGIDYHELMKICVKAFFNDDSKIYKVGKNYYVVNEGVIITINSHNYCIITAHKEKEN